MFIEFQVENFRSFRDLQKFTLQAAPLRTNDSGLDENNVFVANSLRILKTKAIYGGNASGKSNLIKAIYMFRQMVSLSVTREDVAKLIWKDRFKLLVDWDDQPVFFQYIFMLENKIYRYGFQILNDKVEVEWLFGRGTDEYKEQEYFMRGQGGLYINREYFHGGEVFIDQALDENNELFRADALFLTAAALSGNKFASSLRNAIRDLLALSTIGPKEAIQFAMNVISDGSPEQVNSLKELIRAADTGVTDIEVRDLPETLFDILPDEIKKENKTGQKTGIKTVFTTHSRYSDEGKLKDKISVPFAEWESDGTGKLFGFGALALDALREGKTIIIDELDAHFHPNLTLKIVQLFHSKETNPHNAQLIFVTHDTGLLRRAKMRRDQICIVDKDRYGVGSIQTLIEYKGVRKDASYDKDYEQGKYSGIPFLDEMDWIVAQTVKKHEL